MCTTKHMAFIPKDLINHKAFSNKDAVAAVNAFLDSPEFAAYDGSTYGTTVWDMLRRMCTKSVYADPEYYDIPLVIDLEGDLSEIPKDETWRWLPDLDNVLVYQAATNTLIPYAAYLEEVTE